MGLLGSIDPLDPTGLSAAPCVNLSFKDGRSAKAFSYLKGLVGG